MFPPLVRCDVRRRLDRSTLHFLRRLFMSLRLHSGLGRVLVGTAFVLGVIVTTAPAQINTDIIEKYRAELQKQATDPEMKRERGTQPQDWLFALPEGVTSRQITFYSDGA